MEFGTMDAAQYVTNMYPQQVSTIGGMYQNPFTAFVAGFVQFLERAGVIYGTQTQKITFPFAIVPILSFN